MKFSNSWIIVGLSILYIVAILSLRFNDVLELLKAKDLNELGDFLAGFFTPLAFGWLVYGYFLHYSPTNSAFNARSYCLHGVSSASRLNYCRSN